MECVKPFMELLHDSVLLSPVLPCRDQPCPFIPVLFRASLRMCLSSVDLPCFRNGISEVGIYQDRTKFNLVQEQARGIERVS
jgi:hypothetical protein